MANAPRPRGGSRQEFALRALGAIAQANLASRALVAIALVSAWFASTAPAEEVGQWRPRKPASDPSNWSPDPARRLLGDDRSENAVAWRPSRPQSTLAKPADTAAAQQAQKSRPAEPDLFRYAALPRYAALRAEIENIHADFDEAVESQADPRQFDLILLHAYQVQDRAKTPSERALADDLLKRVAQYNMHSTHDQRAERNAGTRSWLGDLSSDAGGIATLILTGHDGGQHHPRSARDQYAASPQPRADNPSAVNPVRGALTRLMSYSARDRDGNVRPISSFDREPELSRDTREPAPFFPDGRTQRVSALESSPRPGHAPSLQSAPAIADQIPLLKQLGGWWHSNVFREGRDSR